MCLLGGFTLGCSDVFQQEDEEEEDEDDDEDWEPCRHLVTVKVRKWAWLVRVQSLACDEEFRTESLAFLFNAKNNIKHSESPLLKMFQLSLSVFQQ